MFCVALKCGHISSLKLISDDIACTQLMNFICTNCVLSRHRLTLEVTILDELGLRKKGIWALRQNDKYVQKNCLQNRRRNTSRLRRADLGPIKSDGSFDIGVEAVIHGAVQGGFCQLFLFLVTGMRRLHLYIVKQTKQKQNKKQAQAGHKERRSPNLVSILSLYTEKRTLSRVFLFMPFTSGNLL